MVTKPQQQIIEVRSRIDPSQDPILWLEIERQEKNVTHWEDDRGVYEADYEISFKPIELGGAASNRFNTFDAHVTTQSHGKVVSIVSNSLSNVGHVFLDLPGFEGNRIGTYLLDDIISWVKQWPEADVWPFNLYSEQGADDTNRDRRNQLFEQFGLKFRYANVEKRKATLLPITAGELVSREATWNQNIRELTVTQYQREKAIQQR